MLSRRKAPIIIGLGSSIPFSPQPFLPLPFILLTFVVINSTTGFIRLCASSGTPLRPSLSLLSLTFPPLLSPPPSFPPSIPPSRGLSALSASVSLPPSIPPSITRLLRQGFALREASGLQPSGRPIDLHISSVRDLRNQNRQI